MRCERLLLGDETAGVLRGLTAAAESVRELVAEIISEVRTHGDTALLDYTQRFDPAVLAACRLTGATVVYRMGGAHAIAALAYGTETVPAVDVIVGPGNLYVQEAKRQVFGHVGIDGFAGPSDLLAIAASDADPELLALDLLAQAEHGPGTLVVAASGAAELLNDVEQVVRGGPDTGAVAAVVRAQDLEQALALAEALAPEHLQLVGRGAEELAGRVTRAGCV